MSLEDRYRRLLCAYPSAYRAQRGEELVGTYLDFAGPGRRWPSLGDTTDLLAGGIRQRLRARGAETAITGLHTAATVALCAGAALATWWLMTMPAPTVPPGLANALARHYMLALPASIGPFATLGALPYAAWVLAALGAGFTAVWPVRALVTAALGLSAAVVIAGGLTTYVAPPLPTLIPQCLLGALALALPAARPAWARIAPACAVAAAATATWLHLLPQRTGWEAFASLGPLRALAIVLVAGTALAGLAYRIRHDSAGLWAALILFPAAAALYGLPLSYPTGGYSLAQVLGRAAAITALAAVIGYLTALTCTRRRAPDTCPACGHPWNPSRSAHPAGEAERSPM
ncbi:MAG TPA: hypothetical protein VGS19_36690 [Streptosporangiaceae bacterium]|nr:hypothetical protein [Streptosporangiaceae bacterium]